MNKIRVLHMVSTLSNGSGVMGFIMNVYRNINRNKIQFDFIYFDNEERSITYIDEILKLGGKVNYITKPNNLRNINEFKNELSEILKKENYKIIHLHEVYLNKFVNDEAKKVVGAKVIAHSHATKYSDNKIKAIRNKILCFNLKKNVDIFFACSKAAGKFLYGKKAFYENRVFVINNAIEIDKFKYNENIRNKVRKELNLEEKFVIGNIGRFAKQKNHKFLIDIFYEVKKKKENAFLLLIGEGDLRESIEKKIEKLNLRNSVLFLSSRKDVNEILQGMDVFVLPSLYEGLPVSVIEAQTSGLPCIISNKVTDEVNIIDCKFLSITNAKVWCKYILKSEDHIRVDTNESITKAGYDIKYEALRIQNIYEKLYAGRDI